MGQDGFGSSIIIAVAAVLWLVYLVPTWLRRREYLATERNALRLQQTLRVLAESAEMPAEFRAENTAKSVVHHERLLKKEQQRVNSIRQSEAAAASRAAARTLAASKPMIAADVAVSSTATKRLRRSRAITSVFLLGGIVAVIAGFAQFAASGTWFVLVGGSIVTVGSFVMLGQMAAVGRARAELARTLRATPVVAARAPRRAFVPSVPVVQATWTPVAVPKPLYMSRPQADRSAVSSLEAAAEMRQASADAEQALRVAHAQPEVTAISSRFAQMGFAPESAETKTDLDAVLARRRSAAAS
jgi:hypothetical protein